jgi:cell division protease FtsH
VFLGGGGQGLSSRPFAEETQAKIDAEVSGLLSRAEKRAVDLLSANRDKLRRLADLLVNNETVDGSDVYAIAGVPEPSRIDTGPTFAPERAATSASKPAGISGASSRAQES